MNVEIFLTFTISKFGTIYSFKPAKKKHRVIEEINRLYNWLEANNFPGWDTRLVTDKTGEFPGDYFGLMFECESGIFANGERLFQFLSLAEISEYYEFYNFAEYMPFALPFALDGCGNFYIFDFRSNNPCIYAANSGNLGWDKNLCFKAADDFEELIKQDIPLYKIIIVKDI